VITGARFSPHAATHPASSEIPIRATTRAFYARGGYARGRVLLRVAVFCLGVSCGGPQVPAGEDFLLGAWRGGPLRPLPVTVPRRIACSVQMEFHGDGWVETNLTDHDARCAFYRQRYRHDRRARRLDIGRLSCRYRRDGPRLRLACERSAVPWTAGAPDWVFVRVDGLIREPPRLDRDADGLEESVDRCPDAPEDPDGVEDGDGCPDG